MLFDHLDLLSSRLHGEDGVLDRSPRLPRAAWEDEPAPQPAPEPVRPAVPAAPFGSAGGRNPGRAVRLQADGSPSCSGMAGSGSWEAFQAAAVPSVPVPPVQPQAYSQSGAWNEAGSGPEEAPQPEPDPEPEPVPERLDNDRAVSGMRPAWPAHIRTPRRFGFWPRGSRSRFGG